MAPSPRLSSRLPRSFTFLSVMALACLAATQQPRAFAPPSTQSPRGTLDYSQVPLSFEVNRGQATPRAAYVARGNGFTLHLESGASASMALRREEPSQPSAMVRLTWAGGRADSQASGEGLLAGRVNYIRGNDPASWHTGIETFEKVLYRSVYPDIDVVYYGNQRELEYDVIVNPGAVPADVAMRFEGANRLEVDEAGDLVLHIGSRELKHRKPIAFQTVGGVRRDVTARYEIAPNGEVRFVVGAYDTTMPLIIDPVVIYSTYLNGSNDDVPSGIAVDAGGETYVAGRTLSADFPVVPGGFDGTYNGGYGDVFVTKLDSTGTSLIYSTIFGGALDDGRDLSLVVDSAGQAYVSGGTGSTDFPTTSGAFDRTYNGSYSDAFLAKLNPTGSALVYSTLLGGPDADSATGLAVDASGRAYVRGYTLSAAFPTTAGAYDTTFNGGWNDAFVAKFDAAGSALLFSTLLGGNNSDGFWGGIALDPAGNAYITGYTQSSDFPTTTGAYDRTFATQWCSQEAYVAKLATNGDALLYSTFIKGDYPCQAGYAIAVDASGAAYVTTNSLWVQSSGPAIGGQGLVSKVDATGSSLAYSVKLPGHFQWGPYHYWTEPYAVAIDDLGRAYVAGRTGSLDFPTTTGAWDRSYNQASHGFSESAYDAFLIRLEANGAINYSTFIGGGDGDVATAIALDASNRVHLAGYTFSGWGGSTRFPTTASAFDTVWTDSFISPLGPWRPAYSGFVLKMDLEGAKPATVSVSPTSAFTLLGETHCVTATVRDANNQLVGDVPVIFKLTHWFGNGGSSNTQPTIMSNSSGQAQFCHASTQMGVYTFDVRVDSNKDRYADDDEPTTQATEATFFGFSPATGVYGGTTVLSARVFSGTFGTAGKAVTFSAFGQPVGSAVTDATGTAQLNVSLAGVSAGVYPAALVASFAGDGSLPAASASASLTVAKATPLVTWNPDMLQAGTPVGSAQLSATASTPGTFSYSIASGTVLPAGLHTVTATFTPADAANYNGVTLTRDISANYWTNASQPRETTLLTGSTSVADPTRNRVYVGGYQSLAAVDATTHAVVNSVELADYPASLGFDVEGQRLLAVSHWGSRLVVYDPTTLAEIERIQLEPSTNFRTIAIDGASGLVWVGNAYYLQAIDLNAAASDPTRIKTFQVCASEIAINTRTGLVHATCANDGFVRAIDVDPTRLTFGQTLSSTSIAPQWTYWASIAVDPRRNEVYVGFSNADMAPQAYVNVTVLEGDPARPGFNQPIGTLTPRTEASPFTPYMHPVGIASNPVTGRVYVMTQDLFGYAGARGVVTIFDAASRDVLSTNYLPQSHSNNGGQVAVNPATNVLYAGGTALHPPVLLAIQDTTVESASTPSGSGVAPVTSAMTAVSLTFTDVTASGATTATPIDASAANLTLPGQFSIDGAPAYQITTTASFAGPITLCFAVGVDDPDVFSGLVILHGVGGAWVPEGTTHDFANRQVCATVTSLSPFAIGRVSASYQVQATFDTSKAFRAGGTAAIKLRLLNAAGSNVSSLFVDVRAVKLQRISEATASTLQDAGHANVDGNFRYDTGTAGYIFNLNTKGLASGTYVLTVRAAGDQTTKTLQFQLR